MRTLNNLQTPDMWTSLVVDFHAKTSALPGKVKVLKANDRDCGQNTCELYGTLNLDTQSLKIRQLSLFEDSKTSYATFPTSGIMQNGNVYQTQCLDSHTKGNDSILLPTPTKMDCKRLFAKIEPLHRYLEASHQKSTTVICFQKGFTKRQIVMLLESMMGFEIGHSEFRALGTQ